MQEILVLYYSQTGAVRQMAQCIARGVEKVPQMGARLRTVPKVSTGVEATQPADPDAGAPSVQSRALEECVALARGGGRPPGESGAPGREPHHQAREPARTPPPGPFRHAQMADSFEEAEAGILNPK